MKWVFFLILIHLWKCNHLNYLTMQKFLILWMSYIFFPEILLSFCPMLVRKITNAKGSKAHVTTKTHCVVSSRINIACENNWEPTCPLTIIVCNQSIARQSSLSSWFGSQFIFWFTGIIWRLSDLKHKNTVCRT